MLARSFFLAAFVAVISPVAAAAQITGFVAQPKPAAPATTVAAAVTAKQADSLRATRLTDMRQWVDSAASSLGVQTAPAADSVSLAAARDSAATHQAVATGDVASASSGDMRTGVRAPDTATMLPLIALVGAVFLSTGAIRVSTRRPRSGADVTCTRQPRA